MPAPLGEDAEDDTIMGDVRWESGSEVSLATFHKDDAGVKWTTQGTVTLLGATYGLVGGTIGALLALGATLL